MIGVIIVVYGTYPEKLLESLENDLDQIKFYLFFHGHDATVDQRLADYARHNRVTYLPYGTNRGLARSWNDGLRLSYKEGNKHTLLINDDICWRDNGFRKFVSFLDSNTDYSFATVMGEEGPESPLAGQQKPQDFACCAIGKTAIDKVGCFDQNFTPAYYEDTDYIRRHNLAGLQTIVDDRLHVLHNRHQTTRSNPEIQGRIDEIMAQNAVYYSRKWGGDNGHETYERPFNRSHFGLHIPFEEAEAPYAVTAASIVRQNPNRQSLDTIGRATGTDKSSIHHNFLHFYERFLNERRDEPLSVIEIGVAHGSSCAMWAKYFPNASIVAVDIEPTAQQFATDRVKIEIADQSNPTHLAELVRKHGPFDLVIDDGSHFWDHQILTFQILFAAVKPHGLYILEDIDTSYGSYVETYASRAGVSAAEYLKRLVDELVGDTALDATKQADLYIRSFARMTESISFYKRTCVLRRNSH